jgi:hypothetical protein
MDREKLPEGKMTIDISEKNFEQQVKELARVNNWLYYHTYRSTHSVKGFPDCVMVRGSRVIFAELKREDGKVSEFQEQWLKTLAEAGQVVYLWRPSDYDEICEVLR